MMKVPALIIGLMLSAECFSKPIGDTPAKLELVCTGQQLIGFKIDNNGSWSPAIQLDSSVFEVYRYLDRNDKSDYYLSGQIGNSSEYYRSVLEENGEPLEYEQKFTSALVRHKSLVINKATLTFTMTSQMISKYSDPHMIIGKCKRT